MAIFHVLALNRKIIRDLFSSKEDSVKIQYERVI